MRLDDNKQVFFELVRAGLWTNANFSDNLFEGVDWGEVYRMAEEQSVVGLVSAGLDWFKVHDSRFKVPQEWALQFVGQMLQIEQRNKAMNAFVARLIELLRKNDIYALLVKGQGIAQCYDKPLWRSSGDVDLLLSEDNYEKAKKVLMPLASDVETEFTHFKHLGMTIDGWVVELHGTLHSRLSARVDRMVDQVQGDVFYGGKVRSVTFNANDNHNDNIRTAGSVQVFLPAPDEDVIFVFTHILHHFFFEGIGLRQICDWCRLLWIYRDSLDVRLLEQRLRKAGLMSEWKAFAAFAVEYLGMSVEAMPLIKSREEGLEFRDRLKDKEYLKYKRKADKICAYVMEVGNFGHNKMVHGERFRVKGYFWRKFVSFWGRLGDMLRHFKIFPLDSIRFFGGVLRSGLHAAVRGE